MNAVNFGLVHNLALDDGRTIKERNLEATHSIPLGALVEVKFDEWLGNGACWKVHARLFVVRHYRDCDGMPLYALGKQVDGKDECCGFTEDQLNLVEITTAVTDGDDVLEWEAE